MKDSKTFAITSFLILIVAVFFLGMQMQKNRMQAQFDLHVQHYNFTLAAYTKYQTAEALAYPFACILNENGQHMEELYYNLMVPALEGKPVCFVNDYEEDKIYY